MKKRTFFGTAFAAGALPSLAVAAAAAPAGPADDQRDDHAPQPRRLRSGTGPDDGQAQTRFQAGACTRLRNAGAPASAATRISLRAVDGYAAAMTLGQADKQGFIVATHLDGQPMALGGFGPLWALYDADRVPEMAAQPLAARFGACPWALYHIEVA